MPRISNPVAFTLDEKKLISSAASHNDWGLNRFEPLRTKILGHLGPLQQNCCAFCEMKLGVTCYAEIEHILPKSTYLRFMFEPLNLVLACHVCNTSKSVSDVSSPPAPTAYPTSGNNFIIVHPHFDEYSDHIFLKYDVFVMSKSLKGAETIRYFKLDRVPLAEHRMERRLSRVLHLPEQRLLSQFIHESDPVARANLENKIRALLIPNVFPGPLLLSPPSNPL